MSFYPLNVVFWTQTFSFYLFVQIGIKLEIISKLQNSKLKLDFIVSNNLRQKQRGLCTSESIKIQAPSCGESKLFFALNIGKCYLKKIYEEKSDFHLSFFRDNFFYFIRFDIHVIYVKKFLTKMDI